MKSASTALIAYLNSATQFLFADLYTFTLIGGQVLAYTSADRSVIWGGYNYTCLGPKIDRDKVRTVIGAEVDSLDITVYPEPTDLVLGQPFAAALVKGLFDGAQVSLDRLFLSTWQAPQPSTVGSVNLFVGAVSDVTLGRGSCKITVKSPLEKMDIQMPRNIYQAGCLHSLYDSGCALSASAFTSAGTVTGVPTTSAISTSLSQAAGYFTLGMLTLTSGALNGLSAIVQAHYAGGGIAFTYPLSSAPAPGDTFTVTAGCDHQQATCSSKFNNIVSFRGLPYIPVPETAL